MRAPTYLSGGGGAGTLPIDTPIFAGVIVSTVLIVGALTYFAVVALGPIIEQLLLNASR